MFLFLRKWALALVLCYCTGLLPAQYALPSDQLAGIPVERLPAQDNRALLEAELEARAPGRADRFAVPIATKIRPATHGIWSEDGANATWRMRISSPGAETLNLGFSEYNLPEGAELYIRSGTGKFGPYSASDNEEHNELWTPVMAGDELMLELTVPTAKKKAVQLYLTFVHHDFVNVNEVLSASCNLDVGCSEADGFGLVDNYRDIIRSVARITIGGTLCTGFLVNNVNEDGRPLFMTANHCRVTTATAARVVAYWNYENSFCRQPNSAASGANGNGRLDVTNSGTVHLASYFPSDFTLLELDDPVNPNANVFFAGWSAEAAVPQDTMIGIHHPEGDEKRISFSFQDTYRAPYLGAPDPNGDHLVIPDWDIGTTQGGSSGSPIFDRFKRVRGQLEGGRAACGNDLLDSYGYFHTSWDGGGTPANRLRDYLDPCGTGTLTIDGLEYSKLATTLIAENNCPIGCITQETRLPFVLGIGFRTGTALSILSNTAGIAPILSAATAGGGETVELIIPADAGRAPGTYTIVVGASGGAASDEITFNVDLSARMAEAPRLVSPADGAIGIQPGTRFTWDPVRFAIGYDFEASVNSDFSTILEASSTTTETEVSLSGPLSGNTRHYWRVRTINECGPGDWTTISFTTTDISCGAYDGNDLPAAISDQGAPEIRVELDISDAFQVQTFELSLDVTHSFIGDIQARLRSPQGTEIQLFNRINNGRCAGENLSVIFTDAAMLTADDFDGSCSGGTNSTQGVYQPLDAFGAFVGEAARGTWTLILKDEADDDGGAITAFNMLFCNIEGNEDLTIQSGIDVLESCQNESATVALTLGSDFTGNVTLSVAAGNEVLSNFTSSFNAPERILTVDFTDWSVLPVGDYTLNFTVTNEDGAERVASITLRVGTVVIEPALVSPEDNVEVQEGEVAFSWDPVPGAASYVLQYSNTPNFSLITFEQSTTGTVISRIDLPTGEPIFWRVISRNDCGEAISDVREFRIIPAGTHDFGAGRVLSVFPNPVKGLLTVDASGNWPGGLNAVLFDATGRQLARYRMDNAGRTQWDLGAIPAGLYYLRFRGQGREQTERLVILP
ncbi:proprotein convertase P-domain-containing protein [Neolewinella persica]|uniref:proprotein convertase P-domain-containing protein n=1 Tax=Neolewinella persica TaxID=70998 RepID=UPI0003641DF1|nr:proprotein convertase P-domain-containing protein [Neolewinella persica]